jgi:hypothetical protein
MFDIKFVYDIRMVIMSIVFKGHGKAFTALTSKYPDMKTHNKNKIEFAKSVSDDVIKWYTNNHSKEILWTIRHVYDCNKEWNDRRSAIESYLSMMHIPIANGIYTGYLTYYAYYAGTYLDNSAFVLAWKDIPGTIVYSMHEVYHSIFPHNNAIAHAIQELCFDIGLGKHIYDKKYPGHTELNEIRDKISPYLEKNDVDILMFITNMQKLFTQN